MQLEEEAKFEANDELGGREKDDMFFALLNGKTYTEEIQTKRGKFTVKYPKQKDLMAVDRLAAAMRGNIPASQFDEGANFNIQKIAFLDVVVVDGEQWFRKLKENNRNFSWRDMPDVNFIDEVYVKAWTFRAKVQAILNGDAPAADNGNPDGTDVQGSVDGGLFSGVAVEGKRG